MLVCNTVRKGKACWFMGKNGCTFPGGCSKVVDKCNGCLRIDDNGYCSLYPNPAGKWANEQNCPAYFTEVKKEGNNKKIRKFRQPRKAAGNVLSKRRRRNGKK